MITILIVVPICLLYLIMKPKQILDDLQFQETWFNAYKDIKYKDKVN